MNGKIFIKRSCWTWNVCFSSTTFVWNIPHSKKNWANFDQKCILVSCEVPDLSEFKETTVFSQAFRKIIKHKISWKSIQWEPSCSMWTDGQTDRRTDRHDEANSRISQFHEST
jgi:hypothetical protein